MSPNTVLANNNSPPLTLETPAAKQSEYKVKIIWRNVIIFVYLQLATIYGAYLLLLHAKWATLVWTVALHNLSTLGMTAGAHRLWSHRSYKANLPLRIFLAVTSTIAFQNHIFQWVRDHRVHHKHSDTDADPHNIGRGFFFSHIGWLLCHKHPSVIENGKKLDLSDLYADKVVMFQKKYYFYMMPFASFIIPTIVPMLCWDETFSCAWFGAGIFRFMLTLNLAMMVNSVAHRWGYRPYDKNINPVDNLSVNILVLGEGWHNYHHVFPWDYKTGELGNYSTNFTTAFIDLMAKLGWAYDLKTASQQIIKSRAQRTGDGSHKVWGWGDKDIGEEQLNDTITISNKD